MKRLSFLVCSLGLTTLPSLAGPYAPAAGQPGSTAVHRSDGRFQAWASRVVSYQPGTDVLPQWQDTGKALGPATSDPADITCLGAGGRITLVFPAFISDGVGPDFVVFENSFLDGYIEHAWVEVSRDGVNFVRFPNHSLTAAPVGSFDLMDPTKVQGLGCKYRQPWGEPYDLSEVGLDSALYVRLVDVMGDGTARDSENRAIYDPWPNAQSAGFDLDAVGVLHASAWQTLTVGSFSGDGINATALAHLPDGRFLLGAQGQLSRQTTWGQAGRTPIDSGGVEFDPGFLAVRNSRQALLGAGGGFGGSTGVYGFDPGAAAPVVAAAALGNLQNYSAVWWQSPLSARAGWLIAGANGPNGKNNLTYLSADGSAGGPVTAELSTYSSGLAVDGAGNLLAALYELSGPDADVVLRFPAAAVDAAVAAVLSGSPAPLPKAAGSRLFQFDSTGTLSVDALGRIWASGFRTNALQVYDPATGASRRWVPEGIAAAGLTDPIYQISTFTRDGTGWVGFLAADESGTPGTPLVYGLAPMTHLPVPETVASWQSWQFGAANLTPALETSLWGHGADPDHDGLTNLVEYALSTPPLVAGATPVAAGTTQGRLTLTFPRNPLRQDLRLAVEGSPSLAAGSWVTLASGEGGGPLTVVSPALPRISESTAGPIQLVTVADSQSRSANPRRYLRLRISLLP